MDRDVGFNPRRGGNCCPAPTVFDQADRDPVRAGTTAGVLPQMVSRRAGLLPTERETKVMSHGRSISVLPNDTVARIMFSRSPCAPLSSLSAQRIIARGIDDVIVGEIFHSAMRESLCAAWGSLFRRDSRIAGSLAQQLSLNSGFAAPGDRSRLIESSSLGSIRVNFDRSFTIVVPALIWSIRCDLCRANSLPYGQRATPIRSPYLAKVFPTPICSQAGDQSSKKWSPVADFDRCWRD